MRQPIMTPNLLQRVCTLLWGADWKASLAKEAPANIRTVQRWASGQNDIPAWLIPRLRAVAVTKYSAVLRLLS